jgi:hypothetical protein
MNKTLALFGAILCLSIISCDNKEVKEEPKETADSLLNTEKQKLDTIPVESKRFNGNYTNAQGGVLTITNFINNEGFTLKYSDNSKGTPCSGNAWEGKVTLVSETAGDLTSSDGQIEGSIALKGDTIYFELSADLTGMDCARFFDADFVKK